jgi:hypothetical protein
LDGGDENDSAVMGAFLERGRRAADLGSVVIVIHHVPKDGQFYRGRSALHDDIDVAYLISNSSTGRPGQDQACSVQASPR